MTELLIILTIILAIALIILVTIQPRQTQIFSMDATSTVSYTHLTLPTNSRV